MLNIYYKEWSEFDSQMTKKLCNIGMLTRFFYKNKKDTTRSIINCIKNESLEAYNLVQNTDFIPGENILEHLSGIHHCAIYLEEENTFVKYAELYSDFCFKHFTQCNNLYHYNKE